jgi:hypothetical protein
MSEVHICRPGIFRWRAVGRCRRCRTRRRLVVTSFVRYGPEVVCCTCGAHVSDGWLRRATTRDSSIAALCRDAWATLPNRSALVEWLKVEEPV